MIDEHWITICCDRQECNYRTVIRVKDRPLNFVYYFTVNEGWTHTDRGDFCPTCTEKLNKEKES